MSNKSPKVKLNLDSLTGALRRTGRAAIKSDVLGSYTGTGAQDEHPVQDADDL